MVIKLRKKKSRQRAGTTHGWGSMKKHRGKGNKGGAGMAGSGKRGDAKTPSVWKNKKYFGKHGFKKKGVSKNIRAINLSDIQGKLEKLQKDGNITNENGSYIIECDKLGYDKLLGTGIVSVKMKISVNMATKTAIEKVKKAGGEVVVSKVSSGDNDETIESSEEKT